MTWLERFWSRLQYTSGKRPDATARYDCGCNDYCCSKLDQKKEGKRDPEMHQTKKGNEWFFGLKAHIGVDAQSGLVHSMTCTAANEHDLNQAEHLLHGGEFYVLADAGYVGIEKRDAFKDSETEWYIAERLDASEL